MVGNIWVLVEEIIRTWWDNSSTKGLTHLKYFKICVFFLSLYVRGFHTNAWVHQTPKKLCNMHFIWQIYHKTDLREHNQMNQYFPDAYHIAAQPDELQLRRCTSATGCQHSFRWTLKHLQRKSNQSISSTHLIWDKEGLRIFFCGCAKFVNMTQVFTPSIRYDSMKMITRLAGLLCWQSRRT